MGSFANTLFMILVGWVETAVSTIWSSFSGGGANSFLQWIGNSWIYIAIILCAAGILVDLSVYIVRWRPYLIWKKIFRRRRGDEPEGQEEPSYSFQDGVSREYGVTENQTRKAAAVRDEEPDLSGWEAPEIAAEAAMPVSAPEKIVTAAGYVVPADSPYRRPAAKTDPEAASAARDEKPEPQPIQPRRRRRRIIMSDLFSDPEEDLYEVEAPQHVIDRHRAYHEPVYPSGWKKEKEDGEHDGSV